MVMMMMMMIMMSPCVRSRDTRHMEAERQHSPEA